ncbi:alpha/beta hydrolase [Brevibacillus fluminis]|uniref:alpha/beta hydrolase n=1 Tax=Brevibacillus fluminis TaxID=511487 RepID=UPI003F886F71
MAFFAIIMGVLLALAAIVMLGVSVYVGHKLTRPPRKPVDMQPKDYGLERFENVLFKSRDHETLLSGWYFSAEENGWKANGMSLVMAHGYSQNRQEPHLPALALASRLVAAGFHVLMFDFRNAGKSGGNITTVGYHEKLDLLGAVDFAAGRSADGPIGLIGFSMGAATALLAAAEDERIRAIVADSPFYSLREYLMENMPRWTNLPHIPFTWLILRIIPLMLKVDINRINPWQAIERIMPRPILFIHGTADETIPHENSQRLLAKADDARAQLWLVPKAGHVKSFATEPEQYGNRIISFFLEQTTKTPANA